MTSWHRAGALRLSRGQSRRGSRHEALNWTLSHGKTHVSPWDLLERARLCKFFQIEWLEHFDLRALDLSEGAEWWGGLLAVAPL